MDIFLIIQTQQITKHMPPPQTPPRPKTFKYSPYTSIYMLIKVQTFLFYLLICRKQSWPNPPRKIRTYKKFPHK